MRVLGVDPGTFKMGADVVDSNGPPGRDAPLGRLHGPIDRWWLDTNDVAQGALWCVYSG